MTEFAKIMDDYQSPRWGAIAVIVCNEEGKLVSIPAMGGNRGKENPEHQKGNINPRDGGNSMNHL